MSLYICENPDCLCIENTALGQYHGRSMNIYPEGYRNKALCSECGATTYTDGTPAGNGKWHGKFPKEKAKDVLAKDPSYKAELVNYDQLKHLL